MKVLIYNELYKIFHKKITIFFALFVLLQFVSSVVFIKLNNYYMENADKQRVSALINKHNSLGGDASKYLEHFIMERNDIDTYELYKNYGRLSWQRYIIDNDASKYVSCMNFAKLKHNNEESYNDCKQKLDELMYKVNNYTWKDFIYEYKEDAIENLKSTKESYDAETNIDNKKYLELSMKSIQYEIDGYNYHLNNNTPIDYTANSIMIDEYVSLAIEHLSVEEDEEKYRDYSDLLQKRDDENRMYSSKYRIENKYDDITNNTAIGAFINYTCTSVSIVVLVYMIVVAGNLIADEFGKGTIKMLLIRPYKRNKILFSKYIASIISTFLFFCFYLFVVFMACGIAYGFRSYLTPVVIYDFSVPSIKVMNLLSFAFVNYISYIPMFLILLTLTIFLGVFVHNEAMTVGVPLVVYVVSLFLNYASSSNYMKYFPTLCWNLREFLWGGLPTFKDLTLGTSIIVCIFTIVIIFWGSFSLFKRKDIKNQ